MEEWRKINNFPDYEVSSLGRVKSLKRGTEKVMTLKNHYKGYKYIKFCQDGKQICKKVHRLVAEAFIPNLEEKREVDHINHIKDDNRVENLRWATASENQVNKDFPPNKSGHLNIFVHGDCGFRVIINRDNERVFCKWFKTLEEAIKARNDFTNHCV
jgi:hypothetical protein